MRHRDDTIMPFGPETAIRPPRMTIATMMALATLFAGGVSAWTHAEIAISSQQKEIDEMRATTAANRLARDKRMDDQDRDLKSLLAASASAETELKEIERRLDARAP